MIKILVPCKTQKVADEYKAMLGDIAQVIVYDENKLCGIRCETLIITPEWTPEEIRFIIIPMLAIRINVEQQRKIAEYEKKLAEYGVKYAAKS